MLTQPKDVNFTEGPFASLQAEMMGEIFKFLMLADLSATRLVNKKLKVIITEFFNNLPKDLKTKLIKDQKDYTAAQIELFQKMKAADDQKISQLFDLILATSNAITNNTDNKISIPSCEFPLCFMLSCFLTVACFALAAGVYPWLVYQYHHADKHSDERQQYLNAALGVGIPGIVCFFVCCLCSCSSYGRSTKFGGGEIKVNTINHRIWLKLVTELDKFIDEIGELEQSFPEIKQELTSLNADLNKLEKNKLPRLKASKIVGDVHSTLHSFKNKLGNHSFSHLLVQAKSKLSQTNDTVINMPRIRKFK